MQENKLIASVALFRELYNENKDIYDVIAELLKAAIIFDSKWSFDITQASHLLDATFGFKIPDAVIRTTLNRLKKYNTISLDNGKYSFIKNNEEDNNKNLISSLDSIKDTQNKIIEKIVSYIKKNSKDTIDEKEKSEIIDSLFSYLMDENGNKKYSSLISLYIIEMESEEDFIKTLNTVREGLVLYNGTRYSSGLNELGIWKTKLTIYLDTEHLFNATGYNGILYKQIFDDFYSLIQEINSKGELIALKYFSECKESIENFFYAAEKIVETRTPSDPSKTAMENILNGSKNKSDIRLVSTIKNNQLAR